MKGINYLAGLGTVLIFIGIYCFKAMMAKDTKILKDGEIYKIPVNKNMKLYLFLSGVIGVTAGVLLILKSLKFI